MSYSNNGGPDPINFVEIKCYFWRIIIDEAGRILQVMRYKEMSLVEDYSNNGKKQFYYNMQKSAYSTYCYAFTVYGLNEEQALIEAGKRLDEWYPDRKHIATGIYTK